MEAPEAAPAARDNAGVCDTVKAPAATAEVCDSAKAPDYPAVLTESGMVVKAVVENTGRMAGRETVQVYVKICREGAPNYQLKGIKKLHLAPGERREVSIHLPREAFGLYDEEGILRFWEGEARVIVGGQAPDLRSEKLTGRKDTQLTVRVPGNM